MSGAFLLQIIRNGLLDLDLEWGFAPNPFLGESAAIKALSFAVRGLAHCRDSRLGVLPRALLWRSNADCSAVDRAALAR